MALTKEVQMQRVELYAQSRVEGHSMSEAFSVSHPHSREWKAATVHTRASQFEKKDEVQLRITELKQRLLKAHQLTADKILRRLELYSTYDVRDLFDPVTHRLLEPSELPESIKPAVIGVSKYADGTIKEYKFVSKDKATELLGRYFGLFNGQPLDTKSMEQKKEYNSMELAKRILFILESAKRQEETEDE